MYNTPEFQALRREYLEGALERCAHLAAVAEQLRANASVDLAALRQEIHKFRGSGGFYGFAALSKAAAAAEDSLVLTLDGDLEQDNPRLGELVVQVVAAAEAAARELSR